MAQVIELRKATRETYDEKAREYGYHFLRTDPLFPPQDMVFSDGDGEESHTEKAYGKAYVYLKENGSGGGPSVLTLLLYDSGLRKAVFTSGVDLVAKTRTFASVNGYASATCLMAEDKGGTMFCWERNGVHLAAEDNPSNTGGRNYVLYAFDRP